MRTPPMSDEELDALARRSAEAYPDELPLGAWLQVQDKLEVTAQQQQIRHQVNRKVGQLFLLEMVLVGLVLLWWQGSQHAALWPTPRPVREAAAVAAGTPAKTTMPQLARRAQAARAPHQPQMARQPNPALAQQPPPALLATLGARAGAEAALPAWSNKERAKHEVEPADYARLLLIAVQRPHKFHRKPESRSDVATTMAAPTAASTVAALSAQETASAQPENTFSATPDPTINSVPTATAAVAAAQLATGATSDSAAAAPVLAVAPALLSPPPDSVPQPRRERPAYRLLLGVAGAPELTAVHVRELARPGTTVGVTAEYRLTTRLRLRSGLFRSVKLYNARGSDYRPPASYWTWRVPIDRLEANCRILEIPLDVRYEILQQPGYSLFASAGLASLLMRNEQYTYEYTQNGEYKVRTWSLARGSTHPFSVLSLSVGYERALGARWAAQVEPFAKLPLGGVGFGKVSLRSAGVLVGFKYGLLASRPKPIL